MAAIDPNVLLEEVKCYACTDGVSTSQLLKLALLRRQLVALDPDADVTLDGLVEYAKCYACLGMSTYDILELALLDQIAQLS